VAGSSGERMVLYILMENRRAFFSMSLFGVRSFEWGRGADLAVRHLPNPLHKIVHILVQLLIWGLGGSGSGDEYIPAGFGSWLNTIPEDLP
jgi:hypothetical protein